MTAVIPLRPPVIPRIYELVKRALLAGCGPRLVCLLNTSDWALFEAEAKPICLYPVQPATKNIDAELNFPGCRVRVIHSAIMEDGSMVLQKEPESPADILKLLYDKERIDSFMSKPHQFEDAQVFEFKP